MDLSAQRQSVAALRFCLYRRPIHPEFFRIYDAADVKMGSYEATIWIVGSSHVLTVLTEDQCLVELAATRNDPLPTTGLVRRFACRGEKTHTVKWQLGVSYTMSFQVERFTPTLYDRCQKDILRFGRKRGLLHVFDELATPAGLAPFTCIDYQPRKRELLVQTWHAFPEEAAMVKTQTLVEVPH
jgi:hypothetical protein